MIKTLYRKEQELRKSMKSVRVESIFEHQNKNYTKIGSDSELYVYHDLDITLPLKTAGFWNAHDELSWNNTSNTWEVGSTSIHIGESAGLSQQGSYAIAIGSESGVFYVFNVTGRILPDLYA